MLRTPIMTNTMTTTIIEEYIGRMTGMITIPKRLRLLVDKWPTIPVDTDSQNSQYGIIQCIQIVI